MSARLVEMVGVVSNWSSKADYRTDSEHLAVPTQLGLNLLDGSQKLSQRLQLHKLNLNHFGDVIDEDDHTSFVVMVDRNTLCFILPGVSFIL